MRFWKVLGPYSINKEIIYIYIYITTKNQQADIDIYVNNI